MYSYMPKDFDDFHVRGLDNVPLNDNETTPDVEYICVNHQYYNSFYNALLNDVINVKGDGIPTSDSVDYTYNLTHLNDGISVTYTGWANDTTKNNGYTYFGYTFNEGIENLTAIDWFEYSDYGKKDESVLKIFTGENTKSKSVRVKVVFMDDSYEFIHINKIDIENSKNITKDSRNGLLYKETQSGHTVIKLKEPIQQQIKAVLVYRWDNIKKYWGVITEFNVYVKELPHIIDDIVVIDANNSEYSLEPEMPSNIPAFGFFNIPFDNSIGVNNANLEKISKSNIILLYSDNNQPKIKYNIISN